MLWINIERGNLLSTSICMVTEPPLSPPSLNGPSKACPTPSRSSTCDCSLHGKIHAYSKEVRESSTATSEPVCKVTFHHLKKHLPYKTLGERIIYVISYPWSHSYKSSSDLFGPPTNSSHWPFSRWVQHWCCAIKIMLSHKKNKRKKNGAVLRLYLWRSLSLVTPHTLQLQANTHISHTCLKCILSKIDWPISPNVKEYIQVSTRGKTPSRGRKISRCKKNTW